MSLDSNKNHVYSLFHVDCFIINFDRFYLSFNLNSQQKQQNKNNVKLKVKGQIISIHTMVEQSFIRGLPKQAKGL